MKIDTANITIPAAAVEAGARKMAVQYYGNTETGHQFWEDFKEDAHAACLAMLAAWPGMRHYPDMEVFASKARIILPLPTEASDGMV